MGKNILIFILGVVTGVILMFVIALSEAKDSPSNNGITLFETEGDCVSRNSFEVFQVLDSGDALAHEIEPGWSVATGLTVLFRNDGTKSYYDDQIIKVPSGKCAKQIGVFKYKSKGGLERTVPIVEIRDR